ncbi:MAG: hypothetical protein AAGF73_03350 [Actinomycetota bacterium]
MSELRLVFVLSPYQNAFFFEIAEALVGALGENSIEALITTEAGDHQVAHGDVFVLLPPHEYVALEGAAFVEDQRVADRTIGISAEQPHQRFFSSNAQVASRLTAVFDFSQLAVDAYRRAGIAAERLVFGHVPAWERAGSGDRDVPVLYFGNQRGRRLPVLAGAAESLVRHNARLLVSDSGEPNRSTSAAFVTGDAKRDLLARTGVVINIHQSSEPYFEWLRMIDVAHGGALLLSEPSVADEPFVADEHYLTFADGQLGERLDELVGSRVVDGVIRRAHDLVSSMPLAENIEPLIARAREMVIDTSPPETIPARVRAEPIGRARVDPSPIGSWRPSIAGELRDRFHTSDLIAPAGVRWRVDRADVEARMHDAPAIAVGASGRDLDGAATLEGLWPWEPWRLEQGQHLGRSMLVTRSLHRAARRWLADEPWVESFPHVAVQAFAAAHGVRLAHWPAPIVDLGETPAEPEALLTPGVAARVMAILRP